MTERDINQKVNQYHQKLRALQVALDEKIYNLFMPESGRRDFATINELADLTQMLTDLLGEQK